MMPSGNIPLSPTKFYKLVDLIRSVDNSTLTLVEAAAKDVHDLQEQIEKEAASLSKATDRFIAEANSTLHRKEERSSFKTLFGDEPDPLNNLRNAVTGTHYIGVLFSVFQVLLAGTRTISTTLQALHPEPLVIDKNRDVDFGDPGQVQRLIYEVQLNEPSISKFMGGLMNVDDLGAVLMGMGLNIERSLEKYHQVLVQRHTVDGYKIHEDPIVTDVALLVYHNIDSHGEIEDGKKPDEVSAYSVQKAIVVIDAVRQGVAGEFIKDPSKIVKFVGQVMSTLWDIVSKIGVALEPLMEKGARCMGAKRKPWLKTKGVDVKLALTMLEELDPRNVTAKDKTGLLSSEEKFEIDFMNETLAHIVKNLKSPLGADEIVGWIFRRKEELRKYHLEENSFYVCRMGSGNVFTGEAPGALTVVPSTRPVVDLDEVVGSGFQEIKDFINQVEASAKWHDLFVATSPSRSGDKSNVLLIGPQGCGKTEVLRAVGGDKTSIGVFAQGSDFLTCWKGEAERNPKRLFEAALKLQKESNKHVHILIDEVDTVLNDARGRDSFGASDLRTEFQILMDGIVRYPHLSVWGATNSPERMPMPIIRRFNKVLIVGELDQNDRVRLLKHFVSFLPLSISDEHWESLGTRLEGATGDVIRKVVDHVWREKMSSFVRKHKDEADKLVKRLNKDGKRFSIQTFTSDDRADLHNVLRPYVTVIAGDIDQSITMHLENVAVHNEIKAAVSTYANAKAFLNSLRETALPIKDHDSDLR